MLNSMGTSEVYVGFLETLPDLHSLYERGILLGRFGGRYYWICNMPSSGASMEWLRGLLMRRPTQEKDDAEAAHGGQKMGYQIGRASCRERV